MVGPAAAAPRDGARAAVTHAIGSNRSASMPTQWSTFEAASKWSASYLAQILTLAGRKGAAVKAALLAGALWRTVMMSGPHVYTSTMRE